ncbi:HpcH/HpaI aldolase/citrate lyase family protein [Microbacterium sp. RD1]|uniref:HpcH/HpaI aldolase/citrate lyase family protein n=1 Tax=Microbacterium sp. RD1 TaxID=3457313 RepID=UPI003FA5A1EF
MRPLRSLLFVPGHKKDWIPKALASGADAVIIDLEDSVPEPDKELARDNAREALLTGGGDTAIVVRVNGYATDHFARDLAATTLPSLAAFLLPMLDDAVDVTRFDGAITAAEQLAGVERGTTNVLASFETARSIENAAAIAHAPRVRGIMAAAAKGADIARSVGFRWTAEGSETLYLRSRLLLAARAADLDVIVVGLWQDVHDLGGLRAFASENAGIGYTGQVLIHPSHAAVVNDVYGLSDERADYYRRLIAAFEQGSAAGSGAVDFEGEHIDLAHAENARAQLAAAGLDHP